MSKRTVALLAFIGGFILGVLVISFAWHGPGRTSTWDDIRNWLTAAAVIIGVPVALYQLGLQRRQLAGQQEVIRRDVQLRERAQAEHVDIEWTDRGKTPPPQGSYITTGIDAGSKVHVNNASSRPIRNVTCELQPADSTAPICPEEWSVTAPHFPRKDAWIGTAPAPGSRMDIISGGGQGTFSFSTLRIWHPDARMAVQFTDDSGLRWELDQGMHLQQRDSHGGR